NISFARGVWDANYPSLSIVISGTFRLHLYFGNYVSFNFLLMHLVVSPKKDEKKRKKRKKRKGPICGCQGLSGGLHMLICA
ncbi:hypothetical protein PJP10_32570, partial [Mycobacterium kansasii]